MAEIIKFSAMHYNAEKISDLSKLVCPPYDMISEEQKVDLYDSDPYNFVNLVLPEGDDSEKYRGAMNRIFSWLLRDILVINKEPGYYIYEVSFDYEGEKIVRRGFVSLLKIEEYGSVVKKHEKTFTKYVEERYLLLNETQTELESIFFLYKDQQNQLKSDIDKIAVSSSILCEAVDGEGYTHKIIKIDDETVSSAIKTFMSTQSVYIADGHHRYETALKYANSKKIELGDKYKGNEPFNYVMGVFFNAYDPTIKILPTHRLIKETNQSAVSILKRIEKHYKLAAMEFTDFRKEKAARIKLRKLLTEYKKENKHSFGIYLKDVPNKYFIVTLKDGQGDLVNRPVSDEMKSLDVLLLESSILIPIFNIGSDDREKHLFYVRGDAKALDLVKLGRYAVAFIVNSVDPINMVNIAENNEEMPHKTTDFYPKLLSGLTEYSFKYSKIK